MAEKNGIKVKGGSEGRCALPGGKGTRKAEIGDKGAHHAQRI